MQVNERPLIAVNGLLLTENKARLAVDMRYADAVWRAGGMPVPIPPIQDPEFLPAFLDGVQGVLLTGGDDFDTVRLGLGPTHPKADITPPEKQDFDMRLMGQILDRDLPVLGVCYGMQVLGLTLGAQILQHLPDDRPGCQEHSGGGEHPVLLEKGTKLAHIMGVEQVPVVSRHHQALDQVLSPLMVCARDAQGLVEALESTDHNFALGVQWHPEASNQNGPHGRLFEALVSQARRVRPAAANAQALQSSPTS